MRWHLMVVLFFFFNDTATTEIYTLSLHDALPISPRSPLMEIDLPSPTALIIGASRGLGLAIAEEYLRRGWHVTGTVRRTARTALHRVADSSKGRLAVEKVDIVKPAQIAALRRRLAEKR